MLFRNYCIAAIAAMAATLPLTVSAQQSSSAVRGGGGAASAAADATVILPSNTQHRALGGVTGTYLVQLTEYEGTDAFALAENPEPDVRRLRELQGNSGGNGKGNPQGGPHKNAAFEAEDGQIFELTDLAEGDDDLPSGIQVTLPVTASANAQGKISLHGAKIEKGPNANASDTAREKTGRRLATVTGDKTVVGVRVVTSCGESTTSSASALQQYIFDDAVNLATQYKACSHDKLNIIKPPNRSSSNTAVASNIENGIVTVNINRCVTGADDSVMRNEITSAINTAFGVSAPTQIADHFMCKYTTPNIHVLSYCQNFFLPLFLIFYTHYLSLSSPFFVVFNIFRLLTQQHLWGDCVCLHELVDECLQR
jgi:hypothetical protein